MVLKFIPGTLSLPSTVVNVEFETGESFEVKLIDGKLSSIPSYVQRVLSESGTLFLTLAVVMHYIDLFIITDRQTRSSVSAHQPSGSNAISLSRSENEHSFAQIRTIPRRGGSGASVNTPSLKTCQRTQAFQIDPFRRRLPQGQYPSFEKVLEADLYGIDLAGPGYPSIKYTWVRPHIRGELGLVPHYVYRNYRAMRVFETLLDAMGFSEEFSSQA